MERRRPHGRDTGAGGLFSGGTYRRGSGLGTGPVGGSTGSSQSDKGLLGNLAGQLLGGGSGLGGLGSGLFGSGTEAPVHTDQASEALAEVWATWETDWAAASGSC